MRRRAAPEGDKGDRGETGQSRGQRGVKRDGSRRSSLSLLRLTHHAPPVSSSVRCCALQLRKGPQPSRCGLSEAFQDGSRNASTAACRHLSLSYRHAECMASHQLSGDGQGCVAKRIIGSMGPRPGRRLVCAIRCCSFPGPSPAQRKVRSWPCRLQRPDQSSGLSMNAGHRGSRGSVVVQREYLQEATARYNQLGPATPCSLVSPAYHSRIRPWISYILFAADPHRTSADWLSVEKQDAVVPTSNSGPTRTASYG